MVKFKVAHYPLSVVIPRNHGLVLESGRIGEKLSPLKAVSGAIREDDDVGFVGEKKDCCCHREARVLVSVGFADYSEFDIISVTQLLGKQLGRSSSEC